jgi:hypothetical protein
MFLLLRSAFWLTIGFLIVAPHGVDLGATAGAMKDRAVEAGSKFVVSQVLANSGAAALLSPSAVSTSLSAALPMQDSPAATIVFPRPRPSSLG